MREREKFEKWARQKGFPQCDWPGMFHAWQAALSTRRSQGFIIVDQNGTDQKLKYESKKYAEHDAQILTKEYGRECHVVELFYEDSDE